MRVLIATLALLVTAGSASAHDMWVEPESYTVTQGVPAAISLRVGHADDEDAWRAPWERIHSFRSYDPAHRVQDRQAALVVPAPEGAANATFAFETQGTHIVALESYHSTSTLEAKKFNDYVAEEGLDNVTALRTKTGKMQSPGVELYSRRAKALVQVGDTPSFNVPRRGRWLIMAVHARPMVGNDKGDFDTIFASLTFGYGPREDAAAR